MPHSIICTLSSANVLLTSSYEKIRNFFQPLVADNTYLASESPNPKNCTQTAKTQQWIVWFTQTKYHNLPLSILFTLLDSNNAQNIWKKIIWKHSNSLLFSDFQIQSPMVPIHETGNFVQCLVHPPIPSTKTTIKIWILYTILLCSTKHILIQKITWMTFNQEKTSNKCYHSYQSPILKFSPSDCLHFINIHPSAEINYFWVIKPFIQPYPNFTISALLAFWP